jgi:hypothetical protein
MENKKIIMNKIKKLGILAFLGLAMLVSVSAHAQKRPNNYIGANGHLYVLYQGSYLDMGPYHP